MQDMFDLKVFIPYLDFVNLQKDSEKLNSILSILNTDFPDNTCQLIAIKSVLGMNDTSSDEIDDLEP